MAFYDKDCFPGGSVIRAISQLPGVGEEWERRERDVVSQTVDATTGINLDCDHSRAAWSAAMHQQSPRNSTSDLSRAGGKAFSSPVVAESHGNQ